MIIPVPQEIQIGSHTYRITFDKALEDTRDYGAVNHRTQEIFINPTRPPSQRAETLVHEILHVINHVFCDKEIEERQLDGLSEGMAQAVLGLGIEFDWKDIQVVQ